MLNPDITPVDNEFCRAFFAIALYPHNYVYRQMEIVNPATGESTFSHLPDFFEIFTPESRFHYIDKWEKVDSNLLSFFLLLDEENRKAMANFVETAKC